MTMFVNLTTGAEMSIDVLPPRRAVFATIRLTSLLVGVLAAATGVAYLFVAITGSEVWWFGGGPAASGAFTTFPLPLRVVNALALLLWCSTIAGMAFVMAGLVRRLREDVRIVETISRAAWSLAIVLAAGSTAAQVVQNIARGSALVIEGGTDPANPVGAPIRWATGTDVLVPNLPLLGLSVVLAVLAHVVTTGERLQQDTDGPV